MSAIGLLPNKPKYFISSHADYRREDFVFARTQSSTLRGQAWERRMAPMQSWDKLLYLGCTAFVLAGLAALLLLH